MNDWTPTHQAIPTKGEAMTDPALYARIHAAVNEVLGDPEESDRITKDAIAEVKAVEARKAGEEP